MTNNQPQFIEDFKEVLSKVYLSFEKVDLSELDKKKKELDAERPLPTSALESLEGKLRIDEVHNSTAIEGNTLTLGETALVLEKGITVEGKSLKDHLEVVGYNEAFKFIKESITQKEKYQLSEDLVKEIHKLMFQKMSDIEEYKQGIGTYRKNQRFILGGRHSLPRPEKVPELMSFFLKYLSEQKPKLHPIRYSALWHFGFTHIHPFVDGNGRVARLIMNFLLMRDGWPIAVLPLAKRSRYMAALEKASLEHDGQNFLKFIIGSIDDTFQLYFSIL